MTPQYSTINKYDLLTTLKEVSIERTGEIEPGSQDLELTFSIVGETNEEFLNYPSKFSSPVKENESDYLDNWDMERLKKEDEEFRQQQVEKEEKNKKNKKEDKAVAKSSKG